MISMYVCGHILSSFFHTTHNLGLTRAHTPLPHREAFSLASVSVSPSVSPIHPVLLHSLSPSLGISPTSHNALSPFSVYPTPTPTPVSPYGFCRLAAPSRCLPMRLSSVPFSVSPCLPPLSLHCARLCVPPLSVTSLRLPLCLSCVWPFPASPHSVSPLSIRCASLSLLCLSLPCLLRVSPLSVLSLCPLCLSTICPFSGPTSLSPMSVTSLRLPLCFSSVCPFPVSPSMFLLYLSLLSLSPLSVPSLLLPLRVSAVPSQRYHLYAPSVLFSICFSSICPFSVPPPVSFLCLSLLCASICLSSVCPFSAPLYVFPLSVPSLRLHMSFLCLSLLCASICLSSVCPFAPPPSGSLLFPFLV